MNFIFTSIKKSSWKWKTKIHRLIAEQKRFDPSYQLEDQVEFEIYPKEFGRIAAQTAKQIIVQRIREAERSLIYNEYSSRVDDLITGTVRRFEQRTVYVDLGKTEAVLPPHEQIPGERFEHGARIKAYLAEVKGSKGPRSSFPVRAVLPETAARIRSSRFRKESSRSKCRP